MKLHEKVYNFLDEVKEHIRKKPVETHSKYIFSVPGNVNNDGEVTIEYRNE